MTINRNASPIEITAEGDVVFHLSDVVAFRENWRDENKIYINLGKRFNRATVSVDLSYPSFDALVREFAGQQDKIGEYTFTGYEHKPLIEFLRRDGSVCDTLCLECGFHAKTYHTQHCDCTIVKPFDGKRKDNALSKQVVVIDDTSLCHTLGLRPDRHGEHQSERKVRNLRHHDGITYGDVTINKRTLTGYTDANPVNEDRYWWWPSKASA